MTDTPQTPLVVPELATYRIADVALHAEYHRQLGYPVESVLVHDSFHAAFDGARDADGTLALDHVHDGSIR